MAVQPLKRASATERSVPDGAARFAVGGDRGGRCARADPLRQPVGRAVLRRRPHAPGRPSARRVRARGHAALLPARAGADDRRRGRRERRHAGLAAHRQPVLRAAPLADRRQRRPGRGVAGRADHRPQHRPPDVASQRRPLGERARRHAGARGEEPAVGHPRRRPAARAVGARCRARADQPDLRGDRPHRRPGRPHGGLRRRPADRPQPDQHPPGAGPRAAHRRRTASARACASSRPTTPRCPTCMATATS